MTECVETRVGRSLSRLTVLQRLLQGQMCKPIDNFDVDADALNSGLYGLVSEVLDDLKALESLDANVLAMEVEDAAAE